jgi:acetoin utilization deacetylase AcuC-like enzyme
MKKTGVFYHDICGKQAYSSLAMGVEEGFQAIDKAGFFKEPNVKWFESREATEKEIARLHSQEYIEEIKSSQWWDVSLRSIGGILMATEKV